MRHLIATAALGLGLCAAGSAAGQTDRYGGINSYPPPYTVAQQSGRVLAWPGKSIPAAPPVAPGYAPGQPYGQPLQPAPYAQTRGAPPAPYALERRGYPPMGQPPAAYYPPPGQPYPPQPYPAQPYPAQPYPAQPYPPPGAPPQLMGAPVATAPSGVYPAQPGVPQPGFPIPGLPPNAYPPAPFPQGPVPQPPLAQQPTPPPTPSSIYAPPPQVGVQNGPAPGPALAPAAGQGEPAQPQMVAMNTAQRPPPGPRLYSVHRPFGLQPDPTPIPTQFFGENLDLAEPPASDPRLRRAGAGGARQNVPRPLFDEEDEEY